MPDYLVKTKIKSMEKSLKAFKFKSKHYQIMLTNRTSRFTKYIMMMVIVDQHKTDRILNAFYKIVMLTSLTYY